MTTVVSLRLSDQVLALIERFAAQHSLSRGDAIKAMIFANLKTESDDKKMQTILKSMEATLIQKLDALAKPQAAKIETKFDQSQAVDEVKKLQKSFSLMLENFVLPNAPMDRKPGINQAISNIKN